MFAKEIPEGNLPTNAIIEEYEMLSKLLDSLIVEMKEFSKKKPDVELNELKIKTINRVLQPIKDILKEEPTDNFLDLLDKDTIPTNSDAVIILGQFESAMKQFQNKYHGWDGSQHKWFTQETMNDTDEKDYE